MKKILITSIAFFLISLFISPSKITADNACNGLDQESCYRYRSCNWDTQNPDNPADGYCYLNPNYSGGVFSDNIEFFNSQGIGLSNPDLTSINGIISTFLPYVLSLAGVILLFMIISGGFTMLTSVGNPEAADAGKQRITAALLGFIVLFVSYWLIQILEIILGINILGS